MKNKKTVLGTILLLFAISGICNIVDVSAFTDTIYIPSSSYAYYSLGYLENGDQILINEIDSDGGIDVYIMIQSQFDDFQYSGIAHSSEKIWQDIVLLSGWRIGIIDNDDYYIVLVNDALLTGRTVDVDISIDRYTSDPIDIRPIVVSIIIVGVIAGLVVGIVLVIKNKKKKREVETQVQEVIKPKSFYCSECGAEVSDKRNFCSNCGGKVIK